MSLSRNIWPELGTQIYLFYFIYLFDHYTHGIFHEQFPSNLSWDYDVGWIVLQPGL
jgi:hypothetical protein